MKLLEKDRRRLNKAICEVTANRCDGIPIKQINDILATVGLATEDAFYCGRQGRATIDIGADNSLLVLTWLKGENDGKYEIVAYLS